MKEAVKKLIESTDELMNKLVKETVNSDTLKNMSADDLSEIKQCFKVIDASEEILLAEADKLDQIEDKLDKLLEIESRKIES